MSKYHTDVAIIGAGPTGLGAAVRLGEHKAAGLTSTNFLVIDDKPIAGGLASTDRTPEGFLFDVGGHVIFSHYAYFDDIIDLAVDEESDTFKRLSPKLSKICKTYDPSYDSQKIVKNIPSGMSGWNCLERVCYVWLKERWVPYPFQNNLYKLDRSDQIECIRGVLEATAKSNSDPLYKPSTFDEWIVKVMGEGIANIFMRPYNFKVWAFPTTQMQCSWLGERVATVNAQTVIANVLKNEPAAGWGPNATFKFPKCGGTGGIWTRVADRLVSRDSLLLNSRVTRIDFEKKELVCESIQDSSKKFSVTYKKLLNTSPLDLTLEQVPDSSISSLSKNLNFSSTHVIGIGLRGTNPHDTKCWLYFPEDNCNFYRATIFSLYADENCPDTSTPLGTKFVAKDHGAYFAKSRDGSLTPNAPANGPYWSVMLEVSQSECKPVNVEHILSETVQGLINTKLISESDEVVSVYHRTFYRGYPTPHVNRDDVLSVALPYLKEKYSVWNRGRFGSWKYEVGNQDHSAMLGVEAVDNMLFGTKEFTLDYPDLTNAKKNMDMRLDF